MMSYTVNLIVGPLSENDKIAWQQIEVLCESYYNDELDKAPSLIKLHAVLTSRYPCLCSYDDDDEKIEESPWADGPMIGNFAGEMGMLAVSFSRVDEVIPFIIKEANALGISVADPQSGEIFRPNSSMQDKMRSKPWWKFW